MSRRRRVRSLATSRLREREKSWVLDRDENAARNIHDLGWRSARGPKDSCGESR